MPSFGHPEVYIGRIEKIFYLEWFRTKLSNNIIKLYKFRAYFMLSCIRSYIFLNDIVYRITYRLQGFYIIVKALFQYLVRWMITAEECSIKVTTNGICVLRYSMFPQWDMILSTKRNKCRKFNKWYAGSISRYFSTTSRSEIIVPVKFFPIYEQNVLLLESTCWEESQLGLKKKAEALYNTFSTNISKASKKIQRIFTFNNIVSMLISLESFIFIRSKNSKNLDFFYLLVNPLFLLYCYTMLKKNTGYGIDDIPIEKITIPNIFRLANLLKNKSYKPKPVKRVFIPKAGGKMRPLGLASTQDKIVQKAILILLEPIFESEFLTVSHGFRKNKSCHSALEDIYFNWGSTKWFLEADFVNCFDNFSHSNLLNLINNKINDYHFSILLYKQLKVGYICFDNLYDSSLINMKGSPQGSLLSPLFCNIILHELDKFIIKLCNNINNKRIKINSSEWNAARRYRNTNWSPVANNIKILTGNRVSMKLISKALSQIRSQDTALKGIRRLEVDMNWRKLKYIRYADDILLGFIGPRSEAINILIDISNFVSIYCSMNFNIEKTNVVYYEKGVVFLGYKIWKKYGLKQKLKTDKKGFKKREESNRLNFGVPLEKLFNRFAERGFFKKSSYGRSERWVGRRQDKWLFLNSDQEIVYRFNSVIMGIANYYSGSTQKHVLSRLYFVLKKSCALTIAHRNNKKSSWWTFNKYTKDIEVKYKNKSGKNLEVKLLMPKSSGVKWFSQKKMNLNTLFPIIQGNSIPKTLTLICSASDLFCGIPNCPNKAAEWHHVKHQKRIKGTVRKKIITTYSAKQIPVCKLHHTLIHNGKYDGISLKKLRGYIPSDFKK